MKIYGCEWINLDPSVPSHYFLLLFLLSYEGGGQKKQHVSYVRQRTERGMRFLSLGEKKLVATGLWSQDLGI